MEIGSKKKKRLKVEEWELEFKDQEEEKLNV